MRITNETTPPLPPLRKKTIKVLEVERSFSMALRDGWTQAKVGCHWSKGPYAISAISCGSQSGYVLMKNRVQLAIFKTWHEVIQIAESDSSVITPSVPPSIKGLIERKERKIREGRLTELSLPNPFRSL